MHVPFVGEVGFEGVSGDEVNPRTMLHRVGHKAHLEQIDIFELSAFLVAGEGAGAVSKGQPGDFARLQRGCGAAGGPALAAREVQLHLDWPALWRRLCDVVVKARPPATRAPGVGPRRA